MCDNCAEARKHAEQVAADMSRADKSREFYRRQGSYRDWETDRKSTRLNSSH